MNCSPQELEIMTLYSDAVHEVRRKLVKENQAEVTEHGDPSDQKNGSTKKDQKDETTCVCTVL